MPTDNDQPTNLPQTVSFEEGLAQLGEIVSRLESGTLGLSASIEAYEQGVHMLRRLHQELTTIEEWVQKLVRIDAEGRPVLEPLTVEDSSDGADAPGRKAAVRAPKKRAKTLPGMDDAADDA